jgi:hypothetical protein
MLFEIIHKHLKTFKSTRMNAYLPKCNLCTFHAALVSAPLISCNHDISSQFPCSSDIPNQSVKTFTTHTPVAETELVDGGSTTVLCVLLFPTALHPSLPPSLPLPGGGGGGARAQRGRRRQRGFNPARAVTRGIEQVWVTDCASCKTTGFLKRQPKR